MQTGFLWIASQYGCTKTMEKQTTSSPMRSPCTCSLAFGMPMTGPPEVDWRRQTGKRPHLYPPIRTSNLKVANGKSHTLHVCQPPLKIGGINMKLGISLIHRKWTMPGSRETLWSMIIAKTLKDIRHCQWSAHWVHGIDEQAMSHQFFFLIFFNNFKMGVECAFLCLFVFHYRMSI